MYRTRITLSVLAATALLAPGCADTTAPVDRESPPEMMPVLDHVPGMPPADTVFPLKRRKALQYDLTQSMVIGPDGGEFKIYEAGFKINVPKGALSAPTLISVTALKGWNVAYEFQPHGLVFLDTVKITQDLRPTWAYHEDAWLRNAEAGYFEDRDTSFIGNYRLFAYASELRPVEVDNTRQNARVLRFHITHFSGYLVSSGRKPPGLNISQY